ncbi:metalloendopeptidase OMA1, mitochondrial-like [Tubulanus polymorphus]|uniref:metalloendopeptidase OMA1, mitochondrial-like n=1 Tax=Tubulanus polymorphus TaxID=672921 RepID=UPI003DA46F56
MYLQSNCAKLCFASRILITSHLQKLISNHNAAHIPLNINNRKLLKIGTRTKIWDSTPQQQQLQALCGYRTFHTTSTRNIAPFLWLFVKPFAKLSAILAGRGARGWWQDLPKDKQSRFQKILRELSPYVLGAIGVFASLFGINYWIHIETAPITGRRRFMAFTKQQYQQIVQLELENHLETHKEHMLPVNHPDTVKVVGICKRLYAANRDWIKFTDGGKFHVVVVDEPDNVNAFVLPSGHIFVFTGLLKAAKNNDQLAMIIGHEMSHAIMSHGVEHISFAQLLDWFVIVSLAAIWALIPSDSIAFIAQWIYQKLVKYALEMPYSRAIEVEADEVGLQMAAKACFDVREAPVFWTMLDLYTELHEENPVKIPEWLSTHPSHENRSETLDEFIPKMLKLRESCKCSSLPGKDPRDEIKQLKHYLKSMKTKPMFENTVILNPNVVSAKIIDSSTNK